jgi:hypothetical protein
MLPGTFFPSTSVIGDVTPRRRRSSMLLRLYPPEIRDQLRNIPNRRAWRLGECGGLPAGMVAPKPFKACRLARPISGPAGR